MDSRFRGNDKKTLKKTFVFYSAFLYFKLQNSLFVIHHSFFYGILFFSKLFRILFNNFYTNAPSLHSWQIIDLRQG